VLFDQGTPVPLRKHLAAHQVTTTFELGWNNLKTRSSMSYKHWNRKWQDFEDFESDFFCAKDIRAPNRIVLSSALDPYERKSSLPLESDLLTGGGCYLFFDSYQSAKRGELLPLYVGRTNDLKSRLFKHWGNTTNFIDEYQDSIFSDDPKFSRTDPDLIDPGKKQAFPTGLAWVAFWYEADERERVFLEHELIFKCRPIYNKT